MVVVAVEVLAAFLVARWVLVDICCLIPVINSSWILSISSQRGYIALTVSVVHSSMLTKVSADEKEVAADA